MFWTKRIKFTRYDGYLGESGDLAYAFKASSDLYWTWNSLTPEWYRDISLPNTLERITFDPRRDTTYLNITIHLILNHKF